MSKEINKKIKQYLKDISSILSIKYAYVFGSYVGKKFNAANSDIDLAIFSSNINGNNRHNYMKRCIKSILKYKLDIQPIVFSLRDYLSKENPFIENEIKARGYKIWG